MLDPSAVLLEGKVAIVTGGGGGIGRSVSETFAACGAAGVGGASEDPGAGETVAAVGARGGRALASHTDVRDRSQVELMAAATLDAFGHVDVLVNNVGDFLRIGGPFLESTEDQWDALYQENLRHVFLCTRAVAPHMVERGAGGSIVNVTSIEAFRGVPGCAIYGTFKHAITGFTRTLAVELGPYGIRVNAVAPETTDTLQVRTEFLSRGREHLVPYWIPLGRFGVPDDTAGAVLFLASDLSAWTTGSTVHVDGGALAAAGWYRVPGSQRWSNTPSLESPGA